MENIEIQKRICPQCGNEKNQVSFGYNRSGTKRVRCQHCKKIYTISPKPNSYNEEIKHQALKIYYSGASARGVGKIFGMSGNNVINWIKKTRSSVDK